MLPNYIFLPNNIIEDFIIPLAATIVAGIISGVIVQAIRGSVDSQKAVRTSIFVLVIAVVLWIGYFNIPFYVLMFLGDTDGQCADAFEYWEKANELQPESGLPYLRIGSCLYRGGDYDAAIEQLEEGKAYEPRLKILRLLGYSYLDNGDFKLAEQNLREVLQSAPDDPDAQFGLGLALYAQSEFDEALEALSKAVDLDPKSPKVHLWLGWALYQNGRYEEAITNFEFALNEEYDTSRAHAGIGFCQIELSNYGLARQEFEASLSIDPEQEDVQEALEAIRDK